MTWPLVIDQANCLYNKMKKLTSVHSLMAGCKILNKLGQYRYCLIIQNI